MENYLRAPRQWSLPDDESMNITKFENWKSNLLYTFSLNPSFTPFLVNGFSWSRKSNANPNRGLVDDDISVPENQRLTAIQKVAALELMLGQIANYCTVISRQTIINNSTSLNYIWQAIRTHFGFQSTGSHFLDFSDIKLLPDERPETLYQRILAFVSDNLLKIGGGIKHHGENISEDEELSPTIENLITVTWLRLVHPSLPRLVKQRYGTELRSQTLASLKPEISQALTSLLDELRTSEDIRIMRSGSQFHQTKGRTPFNARKFDNKSNHHSSLSTRNQIKFKVCTLCEQVGRPNTNHFLSQCKFLTDADRQQFKSRTRSISVEGNEGEYNSDDSDFDDHTYDQAPHDPPPTISRFATQNDQAVVRRVEVKPSPYFYGYYNDFEVEVTIDCGAMSSSVRKAFALSVNAPITSNNQLATQVDSKSPLKIVGETFMKIVRDGRVLELHALVLEDMDVDILAGVPFMELNDVGVRPSLHEVHFFAHPYYPHGKSVAKYQDKSQLRKKNDARILRMSASNAVILPGEYLELDPPPGLPSDCEIAIHPKHDAPSVRAYSNSSWSLPSLANIVADKIRLPNNTDEPIQIKRNEHLCDITPVYTPSTDIEPVIVNPTIKMRSSQPKSSLFSHNVSIDPDKQLPSEYRDAFVELHAEFDDVFSDKLDGYNGSHGNFKAVVNMGPTLPPQRKGRLPQYNRDKLSELQDKFDELEAQGVFRKPEDIGVVAEYLNPSFLVKKPKGGHRLVTAFSEVGRYAKPQPSVMPDVDSTLRTLGQWQYLIKTDLTSAFYQIPLAKSSMKFCGVATPFKGVRVYTRSAMGMPGSETALEELMCRVLGELIQEGIVAKISDDLFCGGNTPAELLANWRRVLEALAKCNLKLSPPKTVIAPLSEMILGWIWSNGTIRASPHKVSALSSCSPPTTVRGLRSFIGAFKVLSRVLKDCSKIIHPLDLAVAGKKSQETITWSESLTNAFNLAKSHVTSTSSITLPKPNDQLWIVTDAAKVPPGIGSTLYVNRNDKLKVAEFFSAQLRKGQPTWFPCEIEALSIAASIKHFGPYITQSHHKACVLTDSKPCVEAHEKLCRGEFSASSRLSTFLAAASRYHVSIRHVSGNANLCSDFQSRNAQSCDSPRCQICSFVYALDSSVVRSISISDITNGTSKLPFTSRPAWISTQQECSDLVKTLGHLRQGTRPSKKQTNVNDVKRYLNSVTIANDGLLVVKRIDPLCPVRESIVVPRSILHGLLTALHLKLGHPTPHQTKTVVKRYFFALNMDDAINQVCSSCHLCQSLQTFPKHLIEQSTSDPPEQLATQFSADVLRRNLQYILVVRENVSSFTWAKLLGNECGSELRDSIIQLLIEYCPLNGPPAVIRADPGPGFNSIRNDPKLLLHHITLDIGRTKNVNKNPIADKAIQELELELCRLDPQGGPVSTTNLAIAVAQLNSRLRHHGLSSREILLQRDQFSNEQIPVSDKDIILQQHHNRQNNHKYSEISKAPTGKVPVGPVINVGDIVYLYSDRNKLHGRSRYLVVSCEDIWLRIRKFVGNTLRASSYKVKATECYKVPSNILEPTTSQHAPNYEDLDDDPTNNTPCPPPLPDVPPEIALQEDQPVRIPDTPNLHEEADNNLQPPITHPSVSELDNVAEPFIEASAMGTRRSTRIKNIPPKLRDYDLTRS